MDQTPTPTRDRIVDAAMQLFAEQGFKATTIIQIETAAGLTPGAGGIYHHFKSKDAVLAAGIERHLQRLDALRDIRAIFGDLGDLRVQLTVTARYLLAEFDSEATLLRVLIGESRTRSTQLAEAVDRLIGDTIRRFAEFARTMGDLTGEQAQALSTIALGGLLTTRLQQLAFGMPPQVDDEPLVAAWVELVLLRLNAGSAPPSG